MWSPTHAQITVHRAKNLKGKNKAGSYDSYVVIQVGSEARHKTTVVERTNEPVWNEDYVFAVPADLHTSAARVRLSVHQRNLLSQDELLGQTVIPLKDIRIYDRPRMRRYLLSDKRGGGSGSSPPSPVDGSEIQQPETRGYLEITIAFIVQSLTSSQLERLRAVKSSAIIQHSAEVEPTSSMTSSRRISLPTSPVSSLPTSTPHVETKTRPSRSLMSILDLPQAISAAFGGKRNTSERNSSTLTSPSLSSIPPLSSSSSSNPLANEKATHLRANYSTNREAQDSPAVTTSSSLTNQAEPKADYVNGQGDNYPDNQRNRNAPNQQDNYNDERKIYGNTQRDICANHHSPQSNNSYNIVDDRSVKCNNSSNNCTGGVARNDDEKNNKLGRVSFPAVAANCGDKTGCSHVAQIGNKGRPTDAQMEMFHGQDREALIQMVLRQHAQMAVTDAYISELEHYINVLVLRVMESQPILLQNPYVIATSEPNHSVLHDSSGSSTKRMGKGSSGRFSARTR